MEAVRIIRYIICFQFWHLAALIARFLSIQLPSAPDTEEEERRKGEEELRRRHLAVKSITEKLTRMLGEGLLASASSTEDAPEGERLPAEKSVPAVENKTKTPRSTTSTPMMTYHYSTQAARENGNGHSEAVAVVEPKLEMDSGTV